MSANYCSSDLINPVDLAKKKQLLRGELPVFQMPRLLECCGALQDNQKIHYEIMGQGDKNGRYSLEGWIEAVLTLICQRCLQPLKFPVKISFKWGLVFSDQEEKQLPHPYEPIRLSSENEEISVVDLVEDELILALPAVPKHTDCQAEVPILTQNDNFSGKLRRPFAKLADFKNTLLEEK